MREWLLETGLRDEILIHKDWTAFALDDYYHNGNPTLTSLVADWRTSIEDECLPFHIELATEQARIMFKLRWM